MKKTVLNMPKYYIAKWCFPNMQSHVFEAESFEVEQLQSY